MRPFRAATIIGLAAAGLIASGSASASTTCGNWGGQPPSKGSGDNELLGVAATSACNVFAGGDYYDGTADQTLIVRWNGRAWKIQPSKNPGGPNQENDISGVAATSPSNAWAVGSYFNGSVGRTLIEHWNGKAWKVQPSPNAGGSADFNGLLDVAATSATNAWAVGAYNTGTSIRTLVEHWNGKTWSVQPSPSPGHSQCGLMRAPSGGGMRAAALRRARAIGLSSVAATSSTNAWAVGIRCTTSGIVQTLIEHWNGRAWKVQPSPNPGGSAEANVLSGVSATSLTDAWAVGSYNKNSSTLQRTLIEHWNGKAWKVQASPNVDPAHAVNGLVGVAATSSRNAWAVGTEGASLADPPLIERWNGREWRIQPSFSIGSLFGIAATSSRNAWAVGSYFNGFNNQALALHCC